MTNNREQTPNQVTTFFPRTIALPHSHEQLILPETQTNELRYMRLSVLKNLLRVL